MTDDRIFSVRYSRDDNGTWLAEVFRSPSTEQRIGVATHGRTLAAAEANVREALAVWFDIDAEDMFTLVPHYPDDIARLAGEVNDKRHAARHTEVEASAATADAARRLAGQGLGLRDVGTVLGLSHQRVQQLLAPRPEEPVDAPRRTTPSPNPFDALELSSGSVTGALALLLVIGLVSWTERRKRQARGLVVKTPYRPLPPYAAEPDVARVYDFTRAWAERHGGVVEVPTAVADAIEQLRNAI